MAREAPRGEYRPDLAVEVGGGGSDPSTLGRRWLDDAGGDGRDERDGADADRTP
jgi:hypothetical protein